MENNLKYETSPYLLQHKNNPVNWYPWGNDAFEEAKNKDKAVFLSIGYSICHWCHVMAHESFEDIQTAEILNENFISIKVDREERPDIDSIYMNVCQAMTGGGGWPLSIFMTPEQKPFFAGTYFPRDAFQFLLKHIGRLWQTERDKITKSGEAIEKMLNLAVDEGAAKSVKSEELINKAFLQLANSFDKNYGGFGSEPKFPMPHNLICLMDYYKNSGNEAALEMAENTLIQMYKGGIFDHIGGGFSRYSTDRYFLVPHFEKMLYDNALLILSYIKAYTITKKKVYKAVAEKTAEYVIREMTGLGGGFYSAQDADSDGEEGKYYTFDFKEITELLGEKNGAEFNAYYGITEHGNFEGKNILNLLNNSNSESKFEEYIPKLYEYRKSRTSIHLDDKILTSWNGLMIAAFSELYKVIGDKKYLKAAENAYNFIEDNISDRNILHVSFRDGRRGVKGFLDDYAFYIYGLINLYEASFKEKYLKRAKVLLEKAIRDFFDKENGGFYLRGSENERLIAKPKEIYDGAIPSGNSVMAYNMIWLSLITGEGFYSDILEKHFRFIASRIQDYPAGHCFFLSALSAYINPPARIVCAMKGKHTEFPIDAAVFVIRGGSEEYPVLNDRTTYYVCRDKSCLPPVNDLNKVM